MEPREVPAKVPPGVAKVGQVARVVEILAVRKVARVVATLPPGTVVWAIAAAELHRDVTAMNPVLTMATVA